MQESDQEEEEGEPVNFDWGSREVEVNEEKESWESESEKIEDQKQSKLETSGKEDKEQVNPFDWNECIDL